MTINMNEIKKGSVLHLRCGGKIEVEEYLVSYNVVSIKERHTSKTMGFSSKNGRWYELWEKHPFDIIKIEPPGFDWKGVKWGMAFMLSKSDDIYWYTGNLVHSSEVVILQSKNYGSVCTCSKQYLTRAPEHDIKVKK